MLGTTILSNGKGHFDSLTDRNKRTGQSEPPSKVLPNVLVGPNRHCPVHLISNRNFRKFGLNEKRPWPKFYVQNNHSPKTNVPVLKCMTCPYHRVYGVLVTGRIQLSCNFLEIHKLKVNKQEELVNNLVLVNLVAVAS